MNNSLCCLLLPRDLSACAWTHDSYVVIHMSSRFPFLSLCHGTILASLILKINQIFNLPEKPVRKGPLRWVEAEERVGGVEFLST